MRGVNVAMLAGNVGSIIFSRTTEKNDLVCNFILYVEESANYCTVVRVNAYGKMAEVVNNIVRKGDSVFLIGKHMNRPLKNSEIESLEIKLTDRIDVLNRKSNYKKDNQKNINNYNHPDANWIVDLGEDEDE